MNAIIKAINNSPFEVIETLSENQLEEIIQSAQDKFFNSNKPLISDNIYDILIDYMRFKFPKNKVSKNIGTKIKDKERKVTLEYFLGSMDKIKPPSNDLNKWISKYSSPYVLTDKLDGISALLVYTDTTVHLSTRGTSTEGLNITSLINYLNLPSLSDIKQALPKLKITGSKNLLAVRGELIMTKKIFKSNWESKMKNARNTTSGLVNSKTINPELANDTTFVAYELVDPNHKILDQYKFLKKLNFEVVNFIETNKIDFTNLGKHLQTRRNNSDYIVDGIVVYNNDLNKKSSSGNPKYAFAFKDILEDQKAVSEITNIEWQISKDGYIKPVVIIKPVDVGGVTIKRVTAYNARFVVENKLGKGAKIEIIRSGDVIPKIIKVIIPAKKTLLPDHDYTWNETKVDFIINSKETNSSVDIKNIYYFFSKLDTKGLGERVVERLYYSGFDTVYKVLKITKKDILKIDGFQEKASENLVNSIKKAVDGVELSTIFAGSNKLGHGHGRERAKMVLEIYPNILTDYKKWKTDEFINKISSIPQWDVKTSTVFVNNFPSFIEFYNKIKPLIKINEHKIKTTTVNKFVTGNIFVFSGFRDAVLKSKIESYDGSVKDAINSKTTYLVVKEKEGGSSKIKKAEDLGIIILTKDDLEKKI